MMHWLTRWFSSAEPVVEAARPRDAQRLSQLHGASFHRGWSESEFDQLLAERAKLNPAGRFGDPEEFGQACAFLCGAKSGFITGQNILLDGGAFPGTL